MDDVSRSQKTDKYIDRTLKKTNKDVITSLSRARSLFLISYRSAFGDLGILEIVLFFYFKGRKG